MGMGGVLDSARFAYYIQQKVGCGIDEVEALVVGAHGGGMVPLPRFSTVGGKALTDVLSADEVEEVCAQAVGGGGAVVELLKTGSAFYAPGASIARMVQAILTDDDTTLSVCARLEGEYGIDDIYMCVPVKLGRGGIEEIVELPLDESERKTLADSAASIAAQVDALGLRA